MNGFVILALCGLAALAAAGLTALRMNRRTAEERKKAGEELAAARNEAAVLRTRLEMEREKAEALRRNEQDLLRVEMKKMALDVAQAQSEALRSVNREQIGALLDPLGRELHLFKETVTAGNASLDTHIRHLMERTLEIGREANELTRALKSDSKKQGNWGEAVLANLFEASGLREGHDYDLQAAETDEEGRRLIPDAVVHFPGGRNVVIDSKVSLTAFAAYSAAVDEDERARHLRDHVLSVRRHVRELSDKSYDKVVPGAIGYVLMFIPNEAGYMAALEADPSLSTDAYARRVIVLNPTNLLTTLQLAYNLWQSEKQSQSVQEIYRSADKLYTKFVRFARTFEAVGTGIRQLADNYEKAEKQLCSGRGNVVSQLEQWRDKGMNTVASMPRSLLEKSGEGFADDAPAEEKAE